MEKEKKKGQGRNEADKALTSYRLAFFSTKLQTISCGFHGDGFHGL